MTRNLILMTLILASAAAAQYRRPTPVQRAPRTRTYVDNVTGNPARIIRGGPGEPWRYAPYGGYTVPPAPVQTNPLPRQYPGADRPYAANASCDSAVMRQNGFHVVQQYGDNRCRWEKAKNWPMYQYPGAQRPHPDPSALRREVPAGVVATPPTMPMPRRGEPVSGGRIAYPQAPSPVPGMTPRQVTDVLTGRVFDHSLDDALENVFGGRPRR